MRLRSILAIAALLMLAACSHDDKSQTAEIDETVAVASPAVTPPPAPQHATAKQRDAMREWFTIASRVVAKSADPANGLSESVAAVPNDGARNRNIAVPTKAEPSELSDSPQFRVPSGWGDVHEALLAVITATNGNIDTLQQAHDGDADAARKAPEQAKRVKELFCSALGKARDHYAAAGGRANDLALFYASDRDDLPCVLLDDPTSRTGTILRKTVAIDSFEVFTGVGGQSADPADESAANVIHDFGVRLGPGQAVTVLEHRRSFDEGVPELCRSRVPNRERNYWVACRDIRFDS